ncbi:MAG: hypothetical protein QF921_01155 [Pseudomonadales bacterium]|jgi:hypothetical protein|nr:hypothetical protein [Pseudomonadales bacterium]MDP6472135.1 hypothetical protein [Pseudomonadales bacterium]MDP6826613.1 hypothetical protein [Pseudomonadales bacterium]MDP6970116.1 hypothetical protein [Pseudomonadales bacterium]|tara:strand:+ start:272 stop:1264 length:993 start_codon:yes stop_codon:yes gene_type:complete
MNRLLLLVLLAALGGSSAYADTPMKPWGKPSLQGTWDFKTATPLSRPDRWKDKEYLTAEEAEKIQSDIIAGREAAAAREGDVREGLDGQADVDVGYNSGFLELATEFDGSLRTSLIVDPPDGRMPEMNDTARARNRPYVEMQALSPEGPEMRSLTDRCIIGFNNNPMRSGAYNNIMQIVQSESHVAIHVEMVNDHRVIATNESGGSVPASTRYWKGFSTGAWDSDTFVVTTTNFKPFTTPYGTGENVVMTERFTRLDQETLQYEYTIDDPETFEVSFTARQRMKRTDDDVYEYACHEGNYSMPLVLKAARKLEKSGETDPNWMPSWHKRR